ncbi:MAG: hypothetical protein FJ150_09690 [Euryarchaeota archaeon]|nr:hypothetical protein [Euryarchaeota archaeon]
MHLHLNKTIETGIKINLNLRQDILNLEKNFAYWEDKISKFQGMLTENNEKIKSISTELKEEMDLYTKSLDPERRLKIRQLEKKMSRLRAKNHNAQNKVKKFQDKLENGKTLLEKYYTIYRLEYYIKLHQKLWERRLKCLKPGKDEAEKIRELSDEIRNNPMFRDIKQYISMLDQGDLYEHFKAMQLDRFKL